jgi:hypothetical protein
MQGHHQHQRASAGNKKPSGGGGALFKTATWILIVLCASCSSFYVGVALAGIAISGGQNNTAKNYGADHTSSNANNNNNNNNNDPKIIDDEEIQRRAEELAEQKLKLLTSPHKLQELCNKHLCNINEAAHNSQQRNHGSRENKLFPSALNHFANGLVRVSKDDIMDAASKMITHHDEERPYPRYLMIIKSSRVGSTFVYQTFKKHYNSSIFSQWEGNGKDARDHFEKCGRLPANQTGIDGKWVCAAHLNDRFRTEETFQELVDLIRDYNASVVIQMRVNAIEKGISESKIWGKMKKFERVAGSEATEIAIANEVFQRAKGTVAFARSIVHAAYHNFIPLPSPTQERPLWIWFEDLVRSCEDKFAELFEEIGMGHLPLPPSCKEIKFPEDKGPYNPIWVETFSKEPIFRPMINYTKFNRELDTDTYRKQLEQETEMTGVIYGTSRCI